MLSFECSVINFDNSQLTTSKINDSPLSDLLSISILLSNATCSTWGDLKTWISHHISQSLLLLSRGALEQRRVQCAKFNPLCPSAPLPLKLVRNAGKTTVAAQHSALTIILLLLRRESGCQYTRLLRSLRHTQCHRSLRNPLQHRVDRDDLHKWHLPIFRLSA